MSRTQADLVLDLVREQGLLRPRDLGELGIPRSTLGRLCDRGELQRIGRGLYRLAEADITEHHGLVQACKRIPQGIVCLLSALWFHGLSNQAPDDIWMAIPTRSRKPSRSYPPIRFVRFSQQALVRGVALEAVEGAEIPVTEPSRTVVDCFRYRNKIGLDVAIEGLRELRRQRRGSLDDLCRQAQERGVKTIMDPYLEVIP